MWLHEIFEGLSRFHPSTIDLTFIFIGMENSDYTHLICPEVTPFDVSITATIIKKLEYRD